MGLSTRLKLAKLHLVTDLRADPEAFEALVSAALDGGVDVLQIRDPRASGRQLRQGVERAMVLAVPHRAIVVVGQQLDAAAAVGADALHLGAAGLDPVTARRGLHQWALLGRSVHDAQALRTSLERAEVDYLFVGPVFGAGPDRLELVRQAAEQAPQGVPGSEPWFAVGSIDATTIGSVLDAGARRVAVSGAVLNATDPAAATADLKATLVAAWNADPAMEAVALGAFPPQNATFKPVP